MDIVTAPPFRTASVLWQPRPGLFALTVVCKATYLLRPGESTLAPEQDPPNESDDHWNDDPRRSLHAASDLAPFKRRADVLLVGHAYAPGKRALSSLVARMIVGTVDKAVEVHADRVWTQGGQLHEGAPFVKMPLRWERSAGGPETWNPVGVPVGARPDAYGQVAVPNVQPPGFHVARKGDAIPPIGFGPLAPTWPARAGKLYGHAARWDHRRWNERPMPQDIDPGFFNAAPPDQQTDELRADERIVLENLHADHPRLVTRLPGLAPAAMVERHGAAAQALVMRCDTLCIDTDRGVCTLVWRGQVTLARADEYGRVIFSAVGGATEAGTTMLLGDTKATEPLPFQAPTAAGGVTVLLGSAPSAEEEQGDEDTGRKTLPMLVEDAGKTLPFRPGSPWAAVMVAPPPVTAPAPRAEGDGTGTVFLPEGPSGTALPFVGEAQTAPTAPPPVTDPAPVAAHTPTAKRSFMEPEPARRVEAQMTPAEEMPAPPPMIGPLAKAEMAERAAPQEQEDAKPAAPMVPAPVTSQTTEAPLLGAFPIESCAAIAASTARRKEDRAKILQENRLTEEEWAMVSEYWTEAIHEEMKLGRTGLLASYDKAYVGRLEEERGPIGVEEYARLLVAMERGVASSVLTEMLLPQGAMVRIQRVWTEKIAERIELGADVEGAVESMRER